MIMDVVLVEIIDEDHVAPVIRLAMVDIIVR
jgi:hypothetical protein